MKRTIDWHLEQWKKGANRKPLLLRGARQVGKTFAVRKLAKKFAHFVEINFELAKDAKQIFEKDLNPERILQELALYSDQKIEPGKTVLFFDEIQEAPEALKALRYFFELLPSLHVIAAGSLLEFTLEKIGMPVGRVTSLYLFPLSFCEFLSATKHPLLIEAILSHDNITPMASVIHDKLLDLVGQYLAIGGMPEAVQQWVSSKNPKAAFQVHHDIIAAYQIDFQKYAKKNEIKYVEALFEQIPRLVGQQFQYKNIHGDFRKRELAPCLDLLCKANVVHKICHSAAHGLPLGAEKNIEWFKLIFLDAALCQAALGLNLATWFLQPGAEFVNRGVVTEAFVGQELISYSQAFKHTDLYFWRRAEKNSSAEVDYIYDHDGKIIPIEVKSAQGGQLKSMHLFLDQHPHCETAIRFSSHNYSQIGKVNSRPFYAVASLASEGQKESLQTLIQP